MGQRPVSDDLRWAAKFEDRTVRFDDLPPKLVQQVADKHGLSWLALITWPGNDLVACAAFVRAIAEHAGSEVPAEPETLGQARKLLEQYIVPVDDDLPGAWQDGNPQEGDQTTE